MDRRAAFFLVASVAGFALTPVADPEHRWVCVAVGITYAVLAVASVLDARSRDRAAPRRSGFRDAG
jgi:hypothetical protein